MSGQLVQFVLDKQAPLHLRERLMAITNRGALIRQSRSAFTGRIVIATCERFEILLEFGDKPQPVAEFLQHALPGTDSSDFVDHIRTFHGRAAIDRLLRVAAGLESRIRGECQVLAQVRKAFDHATRCGTCSPVVSAAARAAIRTGRRVRKETSLNRSAVTVALQSVELLLDSWQTLEGRRLLLLGTGTVAKETAMALRHRQADIIVTSRCPERAAAFALEFGITATRLDRLERFGPGTGARPAIDGIIAASSSNVPLLTSRMIQPCSGDSVFPIIDLGVPRNVDGAVGIRKGIKLIDLEDLPETSADATAVEDAERIVTDESERFLRWCAERAVISQISHIITNGTGSAGRTGCPEIHRRITKVKAGAAA